MPAPLPLSQVKLVYPLPHPQTGKVRDVIITQLEHRDGKRFVPGLAMQIPWPPKKPRTEETEHPIDTPRIDVEAKTFTPVLLEAPMPVSVIDELRNKFSVFRDRHDEDYVAQKLAEDEAAQAFKDSAKDMRSPIKELNRKIKQEKKELGKRQVLTDEMLEEIGRVMARNTGINAILKDHGNAPAEDATEGELLDFVSPAYSSQQQPSAS
jgi:large subunit ribosomal protein L24